MPQGLGVVGPSPVTPTTGSNSAGCYLESNQHRHQGTVSSGGGRGYLGQALDQSCVEFHLDNQAVVAALSNRSARDPHLMHLLRCLFFQEAHSGFEHCACYRPGKENLIADALSRGSITEFRTLFPQATKKPLQSRLLWQSCYWTSPSIGHPRAGKPCSTLL